MLSQYLKKGFYTSFIYGSCSTIMRSINLILLPFIITYLSLTDFGIWDFYQTVIIRGATIISTLATNSLFRFYALHKDDPLKQKQVVGNAILFSIIPLIVLWCGALFYNFYAETFTQNPYALITLSILCLYTLFNVVIVYTQVTQRLHHYLAIFCSQALIAAGGMIIGIHYNAGLESFFYALLLSLLIYTPYFYLLAYRHRAYSLHLLKQQVAYCLPMLAYSFLVAGFFSIDRFFIRSYGGYELLGMYAILWRFGNIFQMIAIAMVDTWPTLLFNAHKEENNHRLIAQLITYFSGALIVGALVTAVISQFLMLWLLPAPNHTLIPLLPFFLVPLVFFELARLFHAGFTLSLKTIYIPLIGAIIFCTQILILGICCALFASCSIMHIIAANSITFILYACITFIACKKIIPTLEPRIKILVALYGLYTIALAFIMTFNAPLLSLACIATLPVLGILTGIITTQERAWILKRITNFFYGDTLNEIPSYDAHHYTNGITGKTIIIVGPLPPPIGGVSIHVQRVAWQLQRQNNTVIIFDTHLRQRIGIRYLINLMWLLLRTNADSVQYHTPYNGLKEFFVVLVAKIIKRFSLIYIDHCPQLYYTASARYKRTFNAMLALVDQHIMIGNVYTSYCDNSIAISKNPSIESPFLPPPLEQEKSIIATYPPAIANFLKNHYPIICINGFEFQYFANQDLYGFDLTIEMFARIRQQFPHAGLLMVTAQLGNKDLAAKFMQRSKELAIESALLHIYGNYELWPLLKKATLFVRPTRSDGYSVSIAEALYLGTPVIASNIGYRQPGTILFQSGDTDDYSEKVIACLQQHAHLYEYNKSDLYNEKIL